MNLHHIALRETLLKSAPTEELVSEEAVNVTKHLTNWIKNSLADIVNVMTIAVSVLMENYVEVKNMVSAFVENVFVEDITRNPTALTAPQSTDVHPAMVKYAMVMENVLIIGANVTNGIQAQLVKNMINCSTDGRNSADRVQMPPSVLVEGPVLMINAYVIKEFLAPHNGTRVNIANVMIITAIITMANFVVVRNVGSVCAEYVDALPATLARIVQVRIRQKDVAQQMGDYVMDMDSVKTTNVDVKVNMLAQLVNNVQHVLAYVKR